MAPPLDLVHHQFFLWGYMGFPGAPAYGGSFTQLNALTWQSFLEFLVFRLREAEGK